MTGDLLRRAVVPVANVEDAAETCDALCDLLDDDVERVIVVHVAVGTEGYVDVAPPAALAENAERIFAVARASVDGRYSLETEFRYGTDAVEEIVAVAVERDATAVVFKPRERGRLSRLLSSETEPRLLRESPCPVIAVPDDGGVREVSA